MKVIVLINQEHVMQCLPDDPTTAETIIGVIIQQKSETNDAFNNRVTRKIAKLTAKKFGDNLSEQQFKLAPWMADKPLYERIIVRETTVI